MSEQDFINSSLEMNEDERERCGCGCFLAVEEVLQEYGYETYVSCNNSRCEEYKLRYS